MDAMKKTYVMTAVLAVFFPFMAAFAAAVTVKAQPYVVNAAFEEFRADGAPVGWSLPKSVFRVAKGEGMNGSGGLVWENDDTNLYVCASQPIALEPGKAYRFGAHVKVDGLKVGRGGNGPLVCVEWYDASGKWIGGAYAPRINDAKLDWKRVEAVTTRMPEGAATFRLQLFGGKRCTGRVRFDNVFVQPYVRSAVAGVFSSAYRDLAADGVVSFHAALNPPDGGWPEGMNATFTFIGADGREEKMPAMELRDDEATMKIPVARLAMGEHKVSFVLSDAAGLVVGEASLDFMRTDLLPRRAVYLDMHKRLVVDGKPFFPLGMYWGEITAERLDVYTNAPFNCLMPYSWPKIEHLDLCAARGLKTFVNVKKFRNGGVEKRIKPFMNHPALLAWYVNDEAPLADLDSYVALYRTLREADSQHPTWAVMDRLDDLRDFLPTCDIMGLDPYPIAQKPIGLVTEHTRGGNTALFGTKPIWIVPQAFDWSWYRPHQSEKERPPTLDEIRSMTWQAVAAGANGLVFYSFHGLFKFADKDMFATLWGSVVEVAREVKRFEDVLLSVEPSPKPVGVPSVLAVRTWRHGGDVYLLAANTTRDPLVAEIGLAGVSSVFAVELGCGVSVPSVGRVRLELPPIGVAMARLRHGATTGTPAKMQNIAHRGMWGKDIPQNTVEAIRLAYESGATWVETDFHYTKSGQMVCIHAEKELEMQTGCVKKIVDLTPKDIAELDLGKIAGLERKYRIPLLDQVLAIVPSNGVLQAEIKGYSPQYADIFDAAVGNAGLSERNVVVSSFNYNALKDFKERYPKYRTVWLVSLPAKEAFDAAEWTGRCKKGGFDVFCPGCRTTFGVMTRADADALRAAGVEFRVYGVNSHEEFEQAKALGATGFTSNFWRDAFGWADEAGVELLK